MTNDKEASMNINIFQYSTPVHRPWRYSGQTINPGINWQSFMAYIEVFFLAALSIIFFYFSSSAFYWQSLMSLNQEFVG